MGFNKKNSGLLQSMRGLKRVFRIYWLLVAGMTARYAHHEAVHLPQMIRTMLGNFGEIKAFD